MGKVRNPKKPQIRPSTLKNNIEPPPNFVYEIVHVNTDKSRHFVSVIKSGSEKNLHELNQPNPSQDDVEELTSKRKAEVSQFLRETLKKPMKYGEFMSTDWVHELVNFLLLFQSIKVSPQVVLGWLKNSCFQKLIKEIRNQQDILKIEAHMTENKAASKDRLKRQATSTVLSSDSGKKLFVPFLRMKKMNKQKKPIEVIVLD